MPYREIIRIVEPTEGDNWPFLVDGEAPSGADIHIEWASGPRFLPLQSASIVPVTLRVSDAVPTGTITGTVPTGSVVDVGGVRAQLLGDLEFGGGKPGWLGAHDIGMIYPVSIFRAGWLLPLEVELNLADAFAGAAELLNAGFGAFGSAPLAPTESGDEAPTFEELYASDAFILSGEFERLSYRRYTSTSASDPLTATAQVATIDTGYAVSTTQAWQEKWAPAEVRFPMDGFKSGHAALVLNAPVATTLPDAIKLVTLAEADSPTIGRRVWASLEDQITGENVIERAGASVVVNQIAARWRVRERPTSVPAGSLLFDRDGRGWTITGVDRNPDDRESIINAVRLA